MRPVALEFDNSSGSSRYIQLYEYLRREIAAGRILPREKLPSLRALAAALEVSVTNVEAAYDQLCMEGYLYSRPQSGYYVQSLDADMLIRDRRQSARQSGIDINQHADQGQTSISMLIGDRRRSADAESDIGASGVAHLEITGNTDIGASDVRP